MKKSAFTLVELMVALAIIGVLLGLAIYGVSTAQQQQRNTERKAALQDINLGIQKYSENFGTPPTGVFFDDASSAAYVGGANASCTTTCEKVPLKGAAKPSDAKLNTSTAKSSSSGSQYIFSTCSSGTGYHLAVCSEGKAAPVDVGTCTDTLPATCSTT
jgi:prepilin-type N-terminal cleavage/methylation domain-containing protein